MPAVCCRLRRYCFMPGTQSPKQPERQKLLLHIMNQIMYTSVLMEEKKQPVNAVKNVFKNGRVPTREEYTNLWIKMINQIERAKANQ